MTNHPLACPKYILKYNSVKLGGEFNLEKKIFISKINAVIVAVLILLLWGYLLQRD